MKERWYVRLALAASIGLGITAGLLRGQSPPAPPAATLPPLPSATPAAPVASVAPVAPSPALVSDGAALNPLGLPKLTPGAACADGGMAADAGAVDKTLARPHVNSNPGAPAASMSPADGYNYGRLTPEGMEAERARIEGKNCISRWWHRRLASECWSHHNSFLCGSCESELRFVFGSCRQFFGEPCLPGPATYPYAPPPPFPVPYSAGAAPFPYAPPYAQVGGGSGCRSCNGGR